MFGGIFKDIKKAFEPIISFFKTVACVFRNFHKIVLAGLKKTGMELFMAIFVKSDNAKFITAIVIVWKWLAVCLWILFRYVMIVVIFGVIELCSFPKNFNTRGGGEREPGGNGGKFSARKLLVSMLRCNSDPRDWYMKAGHTAHNNTTENLGFACGSPCPEGYRPAFGGIGCRRVPSGIPYYCPSSGITKMYENNKTKGPRKVKLSAGSIKDVENYRRVCRSMNLTQMQRTLVDAVCWQAGTHDAQIQNFCYEYGCRSYNRKPFRCGDLSGGAAVEDAPVLVAAQIILVLAVVAPMVWWMTFDVKRRLVQYSKVASAMYQ